MYENIGSKIKGATQFCVVLLMALSVICCFILGITTMSGKQGSPAGLLWIFLGVPLSCLIWWLSGLVLYGFGQLIENSDIIRKKMESENQKSYIVQEDNIFHQIYNKLDEFLREDIISKEEHRDLYVKISKCTPEQAKEFYKKLNGKQQ